jgi:hypothetical protein
MNRLAATNQQLTLPVGGGIGKIFHLGKLPVNSQLSAYVVRPDGCRRLADPRADPVHVSQVADQQM